METMATEKAAPLRARPLHLGVSPVDAQVPKNAIQVLKPTRTGFTWDFDRVLGHLTKSMRLLFTC